MAAQKMAPNSRTILLLDGSANDVAFLEAYTAVGGNTADLIKRNYQGAATLDASASVGVFTRIISLSDKVLVTARILNQLRPFEPAKTEFGPWGMCYRAAPWMLNFSCDSPLFGPKWNGLITFSFGEWMPCSLRPRKRLRALGMARLGHGLVQRLHARPCSECFEGPRRMYNEAHTWRRLLQSICPNLPLRSQKWRAGSMDALHGLWNRIGPLR